MADRRPEVLLVGDDDAQRKSTARALTRAGYEVTEAGSEKEALERMEPHRPDLVVLEMQQAGSNGFDLLKALRKRPGSAQLPVVVVSGKHVDRDTRLRGLTGGATAYLSQPANLDELASVLAALLRMKHAEESARLASQQWQKTFDAIQDGVALIDKEGRIQQVNRAMSGLLRKTRSELRGKPMQEALLQALGQFDVSAIPSVRASRRQSAEFLANGRWFFTTVDPVLDGDGAIEGSVKVITEITDRKRSEAALTRAQDALRMSEKLAATGRLAASIAHEINNPMASVTNLLYLLENRPGLDQQTLEYLHMARQEVGRMTHIVKQMLGFYRESPMPVAVDLREVVDSVLGLYSRKIEHSRVTVQTRMEGKCVVWGYPGEMRQVISNLLINAIEAVGEGGRIRLRIRETMAWVHGRREHGVRMLLADSGPGIQREHLRQLFEPFFTTKGEKGTGLGLWVTNGIVRKHGGSIRVRSCLEPGRRGTSFGVFLPVQKPHTSAGAGEPAHTALSA